MSALRPCTTVAVVGVLLGAPATADADAHETSVHVQAFAGTAKLGDPTSDASSDVSLSGGSVRFTWATENWFAWQVEGYGGVTSSARYTNVRIDDSDPGRFGRGANVAGLEAGAGLRLGVTIIPRVALAVGPQFRWFPTAPLISSVNGLGAAMAPSSLQADLAARASVGVDWRLGARWVVGARASARQSAGLMGDRWQSVDAGVQASFYWYPGFWEF